MATSMEEFDVWLTQKLKSLSEDLDTDVFVSYIVGILDTESPEEETTESIEEFLSQVLDPEKSTEACEEIVSHWNYCHGEALAKQNAAKKDAGDMLAELMKQNLATVKEVKMTAEDRARKEAILAQYSHISDGEETDDEPSGIAPSSGKGSSGYLVLQPNANASAVTEAMQAQREKDKQEHEKKKDKDKQDREAQRQKKEQRKEAEKKRTQKGEKRR